MCSSDLQGGLFLSQRFLGTECFVVRALSLSLLQPGSAVPGSPFFISRAELTVGSGQDRLGLGDDVCYLSVLPG